MKAVRSFESPDGIRWRVDVPQRQAGGSNAMIIFRHPDPSSSRLDRYAWYQFTGPEARNVTARLSSRAVLDSLGDEHLALLFRRSMLVSAADDPHWSPVASVAS